MNIISDLLKSRVESEKAMENRYETLPENELTLENLFGHAATENGDMYDSSDSNARYSKETLYKFLESYSKSKNIKAVESMKNYKDFFLSKGYSNPFSKSTINAIAGNIDERAQAISLISQEAFADSGDTHMQQAFENVFYNSLDNIHRDPAGSRSFFKNASRENLGVNNYAMEGIGVTDTYQNEDHFSGTLGFGILNYFARMKTGELVYVIKNNDKPEFSYRYILEYAIDPRTNEKLALPDAERDGRLLGAFDLDDAIPTYINANQTPQIMEPAKIPVNDGVGEHGWVKTGMLCNLLSTTPGIDKDFNSLEPDSKIVSFLYVSGYTGDDKGQPEYSILNATVHLKVSEGLSTQRVFGHMITVPKCAVIDSKGAIVKNVDVDVYISGYIHIGTGDALVTTTAVSGDVSSPIVAVKYAAKITDTANLRGGLQTTIERHIYIMRSQYTRSGTVPINPHIGDNWNLGNSTIGYPAMMVDSLSKRFATTRDLKTEKHLEDEKKKPGNTYPLYAKLGAFVADVVHDMTEAAAGGAADLLANSQHVLKSKLIYKLIDLETDMNFDENIEKLWCLMGHEKRTFAFQRLRFDSEAMDNSEVNSSSATRWGFDVGASVGFKDEYGRRVRVIGAKDKRWDAKGFIGVLRSNNLSAPTTVYMPFMFRIFTGIDPKFTNLSSIHVMGRDAIETLSKAQINLNILELNSDTQSKLIKSTKERISITADRD